MELSDETCEAAGGMMRFLVCSYYARTREDCFLHNAVHHVIFQSSHGLDINNLNPPLLFFFVVLFRIMLKLHDFLRTS